MIRFAAVWPLLVIGLNACQLFTGADDSREGSLSATIDGTAWVSTGQSTRTRVGEGVPNGLLEISGSRTDDATTTRLDMTLAFVSGPGTYPLGVNIYVVQGGTALVRQDSAQSRTEWFTFLERVVGTVTITSLTSDRVAGTFHYNATLIPDYVSPMAMRSVTEGSFDLPLPPEFTPATPSDLGHAVRATADGSDWYAAAVVVRDMPGVHITAGSDTMSLTIDIDPPIVVGATYHLQDGSHSMAATRVGSRSWGGVRPGTFGTITITEYSDTRAAGTFQATLAPWADGIAPIVITYGQFSIRRNR